METLTREQVDLERISLGLRMKEGFDLRKIRKGPKTMDILGRLEGTRVMPTREGYAVADALPLCLI
ncbi:MAG: hypothetical protein JRJ60_10250 [Deltaproteobacteria bacterium]|nr:hypothetical protein [Deltaproteobacteria bacterium]